MEDTSDSSSEDDNDNIFQAICDPTMSANYSMSTDEVMKWNKMKRQSSSSNNIQPVTGDNFVDCLIHSLKMNLADLAVQRFSKAPDNTEGGLSRERSAGFVSRRTALSNGQKGGSQRGALIPVPYAVKRMAQVLESQITIRSHNRRPKHRQRTLLGAVKDPPDSNPNDEDLPDDGEDEERLQLLQSVAYNPNLPQQDLNQTSNEWLRKVKKRYNACYYSSEEEDLIENRCRALALPAAFIASGGLKSMYAEHRNTNPLKVQRVRLCKSSKNGVLLIAPLATGARNAVTSTQHSANKKQTAVTIAADLTGIHKENLFKTQATNTTPHIENGLASPSGKKVKKKARKRGPKKKKVISMNGESLEHDSKVVGVQE